MFKNNKIAQSLTNDSTTLTKKSPTELTSQTEPHTTVELSMPTRPTLCNLSPTYLAAEIEKIGRGQGTNSDE